MKEPAKDFDRFSESETTKNYQADVFFQQESEQKPTSLSISADNNENKKPSFWKLFWEAYNRFYDRIKPVLIVLWITVFIVFVLPHFGAFIIARSLLSSQELSVPQEHSEIIFDESKNTKLIFVSQTSNQTNIERNQIQINTELLNALDYAHVRAEVRATKKLDSYIDNLMFRVDNDFFDWYFNFFHKKWREDSSLITWILGENVKESQEKIFIEEFSKRVVSKTEAEQKIKQIVDDAAKTYVSVLKHKLDRIGFKYSIPQNQWNEYLDNVTFNLPGTGNSTLAEISAVGVYPLVKAIAIPSLKKVSILGAEKITAVAGAKYATKLGIKGVSETAIGTVAKAADPLVLVGFVLWEVGDHQATVKEQKPALHDSIFETFKEIEDDILYDRNSGIMTTLYDIENSIRNSIISISSSQDVSIPIIRS